MSFMCYGRSDIYVVFNVVYYYSRPIFGVHNAMVYLMISYYYHMVMDVGLLQWHCLSSVLHVK